jgi:hypothetical protein
VYSTQQLSVNISAMIILSKSKWGKDSWNVTRRNQYSMASHQGSQTDHLGFIIEKI